MKDQPNVPGLPPLKVLVAEDNAINQVYTRCLLMSRGHLPTMAANGSEALLLLAEAPYDLVLMDMQMPVMDGVAALRRIRSGEVPGVRPDQPVVALTAFAMPGDRERFMAAGADGYVAKPIEPTELFRVMAMVLRRSTLPAADMASAPAEAAPVPSPALDVPPVLDANKALRRMRNNLHLMRQLYEVFLGECEERYEALRLATASDNRVEVHKAAHAFANSAGILGGEALTARARTLQRLAKGDEDLSGPVAEFGLELERTRRAMSDFLQAPAPGDSTALSSGRQA